jgi:Tfp pilus assembly protein PilV
MRFHLLHLRERRGPHVQFGVSLIEVMISLVLVSTVLLVSLTASANLLRNDAQRRGANQGQQLAAQLLDEVSSMDFRDRVDPIYGLESNETAGDRNTFDDVDDYNGYTAAPPTHRDGTTIDGYKGWSFSVSITPADPDATGITTTTSNEHSPLRIITVVCTTPAGTTVEAATLVSNVPNDSAPTNSYEKWRRVKLTFPDREVNVTAPLRNFPDPYGI